MKKSDMMVGLGIWILLTLFAIGMFSFFGISPKDMDTHVADEQW